jgi:SAM-dependent methyltransferase
MNSATKLFVKFLDSIDKLGSSASIHLTRITGKAAVPIHPKHLLDQDPFFQKVLQSEDVVLDVGCGNGMNTLKSAKYVKTIVGFDLNLDEVKKAKTLSKIERLKNVEFILSDAETFCPFVENTFNKILLIDVLEHLNNRNRLLRSLSRLLKRKGILILSIPNRDTRWKRVKRDAGLSSFAASDHKIEYDKESLSEELSTSGWRILEINPIVVDTPLAGIMDAIGGISLRIYSVWQKWKMERCLETPDETTGWRIIAVPKPADRVNPTTSRKDRSSF